MGANSVIIDKLKIAEDTTIGAGAVVLKDIEFHHLKLAFGDRY
mgnify:CR=1 FL=1